MDAVVTPASVLAVLHVEGHSGPQRDLEPRLRRLADGGARITTMVPADGPAAELAAGVGDVVHGYPGALVGPRTAFDAARMPGLVLRQARAVAATARSVRAELAIASSALLPGALVGARRGGAATLLYSGEPLAAAGWRGATRGAVARFAGRRADAVLACSHHVARSYLSRGIEATVLHPPIAVPGDREAIARRGAELRRRLGVGAGERLVCSLGAITEGRGQDALVDALAISARRGRGWRLVIGGESYDRSPDRAFAARLGRLVDELGLGDRVRFAGRVDDPNALFAAADLLVNPARVDEAFGRAACEALTVGCPVVSTRVGGVVEALTDGETALLVEPDSPPALAAAIERLLGAPPLAERLARAGADDVSRRFDPAVGQPVFDAAVAAALAARADRSLKSTPTSFR